MSAREDEIRRVVAELDVYLAEVEARVAVLKSLMADDEVPGEEDPQLTGGDRLSHRPLCGVAARVDAVLAQNRPQPLHLGVQSVQFLGQRPAASGRPRPLLLPARPGWTGEGVGGGCRWPRGRRQ